MIMLVIKGMKRLQIRTKIIALLAILIAGCNSNPDRKELNKYFDEHLIECNRNLTRVVITDVLTPPVCSRVYAYTNIAAYEALAAGKNSYAGKLNGLNKVPVPEGKEDDYYLPLSAIMAFCTVAQKVVFNSDAVKDMEDEFLAEIDKFEIDPEVFERSVNYGRIVGNFILEWASHDDIFSAIRSLPILLRKKTGAGNPHRPTMLMLLNRTGTLYVHLFSTLLLNLDPQSLNCLTRLRAHLILRMQWMCTM